MGDTYEYQAELDRFVEWFAALPADERWRFMCRVGDRFCRFCWSDDCLGYCAPGYDE